MFVSKLNTLWSLACASLLLAACDKSPQMPVDPTAVGVSSPADSAAVAMPDLAVRHNCVSCHLIDKKKIGPSWMDISRKYKGLAEYDYYGERYPLVEGLVVKISKGGSGVWGQMPMPANDLGGQKQADMRQLVEFILALEK